MDNINPHFDFLVRHTTISEVRIYSIPETHYSNLTKIVTTLENAKERGSWHLYLTQYSIRIVFPTPGARQSEPLAIFINT